MTNFMPRICFTLICAAILAGAARPAGAQSTASDTPAASESIAPSLDNADPRKADTKARTERRAKMQKSRPASYKSPPSKEALAEHRRAERRAKRQEERRRRRQDAKM